MTGKGTFLWTSAGTLYEDDVCEGNFHSWYNFNKFGWFNLQRLLEAERWAWNWRTEYQNSDIYKGLWKENMREGSGRFVCSNDSVYIGSWSSGKKCGRGTFEWLSRVLFAGFWLNGSIHGSGFYWY